MLVCKWAHQLIAEGDEYAPLGNLQMLPVPSHLNCTMLVYSAKASFTNASLDELQQLQIRHAHKDTATKALDAPQSLTSILPSAAVLQ